MNMKREIRIILTSRARLAYAPTPGIDHPEKYAVEVWENGQCVGGTWTDNPRLSVTDLEWLENKGMGAEAKK